MKVAEIINQTDHRELPLPETPWKFYQEWNEAIFLHWPVSITSLKKHVPAALEIDLFDESAWVSLVAFTMENSRLRNFFAFPPISNFHEINIRTYVKLNGKPGVYFLSIEGGKRISCKVARQFSELPYRYSDMQRNEGKYLSSNAEFTDRLTLQFTPGSKIQEKDALTEWLTERYALFQDAGPYINAFDIHHVEWPLQEIEIDKLLVNYPRYADMINNFPDTAHYSPGVQVLAWGMDKRKITDFVAQ